MSEPDPNRWQAAPAPENPHLLLAEMNASRLQTALLPVSVYDAMLCVNGLAVLESAMTVARDFALAQESQRLQRFLLKHVAFTPAVREQMQKNRRFLELEELKA